MSRIKDLQKRVHRELKDMEDYDKYARAMDHLHGVSLAAVIIAKRRGEDPELAAMAGLLHDVYAYKKGSYEDHAHLGSAYVRKLLEKAELTTPEETEIICSAIWHHSDKETVDSPMDEVLKDADVLHHTLDDPTKAVKEQERERYEHLCLELGMGV
ncbi:MAG: HD domain-containing protein [Clostridia bacterium]|nr:HD domain-containing protein [Clostridia bacterium]